MKMLAAVLVAAALAAPLHAAPTATFDPARLSAHIKIVSSDAFEGRAPATPGETRTVAYLTEQMRAARLAPGGDLVKGKRSWTQKVPLLRSDIVGTPNLTLTMAGKPMSLVQGEQIAVRSAMNGAKQVAIRDAPLLFVGYGVSAPERKWDDFKGVDVRGKMLVMLINDPDFETGNGEFGGKAMTYYGRWTYK